MANRSTATANPLLESWRSAPLAISILRAFLGITFIYAGLNKFLDGNFLHVGSPDYIGAQLNDFAQGSPLAPLLHLAAHVPQFTGVMTALLEIAIGVATLLAIAPISAAVAGAVVNITLTLSASWHIHPYFLGSDSIYAIAWIAYAAGLIEMQRLRKKQAQKKRQAGPTRPVGLDRRAFLRGGAVAVITLGAAAVSRRFVGPATTLQDSLAAGGTISPTKTPSTPHQHVVAEGPPAPAQTTAPPAVPTHTHTPKPPPAGTKIANFSKLQVGDAAAFEDPKLGPCAVVRLTDNKCAAFSRICTHAGCEVGYDSSTQIFYCPCHGAEFDPSRDGKAIAGPTNTPLQSVDVLVDRQTGDVILPD